MNISDLLTYYLDNRHKLWLKILLWSLVVLLFLWAHGFFKITSSLYYFSLMTVSLNSFVILSYYGVTRFIYPAFRASSWLKFLTQVLLLFFVGVFFTRLVPTIGQHWSLTQTEEKSFSLSAMKGPWDVFSIESVVFFWNVFWLVLFTCLMFFVREFIIVNRVRKQALFQRNQMEINFLRAQIQPHFLFNTLNNIYSMLIDQQKASRVLLELADVLRYSLYKTKSENVSLNEETAFLEKYLSMEGGRLKEKGILVRYRLVGTCPQPFLIAPLLLMQAIEAILIAAEQTGIEGQGIDVVLNLNGDRLTLRMEHPLPTLEKGTVPSGYGGIQLDERLAEIRRRLSLEYGDRHSLTFQAQADRQVIILTLQLAEGEASRPEIFSQYQS